MNKKLLVISLAFSAATISSSAFALDGGQIDFAGLVSDNTCVMSVNNGAQDAQIQLETASVDEVNTAGVVKAATAGAKPKAFTISVDCSKAGFTTQTKADLTMTSQFHSNGQGTLNNDPSITNEATGVNVAIHEVNPTSGVYSMVTVDGKDVHSQTFNTDKKAQWSFVASYVAQTNPAATPVVVPVAAGFVKTNAAYTIAYN
ncbi:fimbrial protein [Citrobacter portucalensis]|uniref:fimbrial protein n=1 Tax=Citrobacter portucalensis TaxID=1639133 RepID=UPI001EF8C35F|nr:fimbrial protein [Citrobacter portucalensis]ULK52334.1 fimbrial protein [Citrobacter portucalensis]